MCIDFEITGGLSVQVRDSTLIFRLCCTEHHGLALLEDLDEFAWNNVKDKFASLDLRRFFLVQFRCMVSQWWRRSRTQLVVSIIRGQALSPKTLGW
jgi:hypothetical protein